MMKPKSFRTIFSILVFCFFIIIFFVSNDIIAKAGNFATQIQFVPALLRIIAGGMSLISIFFILTIVLTFMFGRVYCSFLCPLGIMQDGLIFLGKIFRKKHKFIRPFNWIKFTVLFVTAVSLFSGSLIIINLTDPYSVFGRITTDIAKPVVLSAGNFIIWIMNELKIYPNINFSLHNPEIFTVLTGLAFLLTIVVFSLARGRLYCNTICPAGTILGLVSKFSVFKISIDDTVCSSCGICEKKCKAGCIDAKNKTVDFSRCVACYNCLDACPKDSLKYRFSPAGKTVNGNSRREFLKESGGIVAGILAVSGLPLRSFARQKLQNGSMPGPGVVAPPGAVSFENLTDLCTGCHLCVSTCPTKVIKPAFLEYGLSGMMQPRMDYTKAFCDYECTRCTKVCPTGALKPLKLEDKKQTQIGRVELTFARCVVFTEKNDCGACAEHCPTGAVYMITYEGNLRRPVTAVNQCIGCGACQHICPVVPEKAIVVKGNPAHLIADKPKVLNPDLNGSGGDKNVPKEFPF